MLGVSAAVLNTMVTTKFTVKEKFYGWHSDKKQTYVLSTGFFIYS